MTDSHGRIDPGMTPLWHLATVASSFIMLNESTEDTLYNMAQVANITQLVGCLSWCSLLVQIRDCLSSIIFRIRFYHLCCTTLNQSLRKNI